MLFLKSLIEVADLRIQVLDAVAVVDRVLGLRADGRCRGTATAVLNVRGVEVAARLDHLLDLGPVLLILHLLYVELTAETDKFTVLSLDSDLELGGIFGHVFLGALDEVFELHDFLVLSLECEQDLVVFVAKTGDDHLLLLKAFLDDADLLRVGEGVLASDDLFELGAQPSALVDVKLHLDLDLRDLGRLDVPLQSLHFVRLRSQIALELSDLSL